MSGAPVSTPAPALRSSGDDVETRERLLESAARLFSERGFAAVTVRDICAAAHANVAAVNYHFAGKLGLYQAVMRMAIARMQDATAEGQRAGEGLNAEGRLRAYVQVFVTRVVAGQQGWIHQLMMRELSDPTPALDLVVAEVLRPRLAYLAAVVAELIGCDEDDPRVMRATFSVHAQCVGLMGHPIARRVNPVLTSGPDALEAMVDHITEFSLAGLWALARRG